MLLDAEHELDEGNPVSAGELRGALRDGGGLAEVRRRRSTASAASASMNAAFSGSMVATRRASATSSACACSVIAAIG